MNKTKKKYITIYQNLSYDKVYRYVLYYYQIHNVVINNPDSILDIGSGNKTVAEQLRKYGFNVTTCDIDEKNDPDKIGDIRNLPFKDDAFETVVACEVLEHIPFLDFEKSLLELSRVSKKNVVISIPFFGSLIGGSFKVKLKIFGKKIDRQFRLFLRIPYFNTKIDFEENKKHYWEMGAMGCSKKDLRKIISKHFKIEREFHAPLVEDRYFFILTSKSDEEKYAKN